MFVVSGCDIHYGCEIPGHEKYVQKACSPPIVLEVPRRPEKRTVQQEWDAHVTAWKQGLYSRSRQKGPCPLCPAGKDVARIKVAQSMEGERPTHFFVSIESDSRSNDQVIMRVPTPSASLSAYNKLYRLVAVISRSLTGVMQKYSCRALCGGCWHAYSSDKDATSEVQHEYKPDEEEIRNRSEPVLMAYVLERPDVKEPSLGETPYEEARRTAGLDGDKRDKAVSSEFRHLVAVCCRMMSSIRCGQD